MSTATYGIKKRSWKRLSMAGFALFLIKGLIWLAAPIVMYLMGTPG